MCVRLKSSVGRRIALRRDAAPVRITDHNWDISSRRGIAPATSRNRGKVHLFPETIAHIDGDGRRRWEGSGRVGGLSIERLETSTCTRCISCAAESGNGDCDTSTTSIDELLNEVGYDKE